MASSPQPSNLHPKSRRILSHRFIHNDTNRLYGQFSTWRMSFDVENIAGLYVSEQSMERWSISRCPTQACHALRNEIRGHISCYIIKGTNAIDRHEVSLF